RNLDGQNFGGAQRGSELIALDESADAQDFRFDGGCDGRYRGWLHCFQEEGGQRCPPSDSTAADLRGSARINERRRSKFIAKLYAEHARTVRCLRHHELR